MSKPIDPYEALRAIDHYHLIGVGPWCEFNGTMQPVGDVCKQAVENIPPKYKHADELIEAADALVSYYTKEHTGAIPKHLHGLYVAMAKCKESPNAHLP